MLFAKTRQTLASLQLDTIETAFKIEPMYLLSSKSSRVENNSNYTYSGLIFELFTVAYQQNMES